MTDARPALWRIGALVVASLLVVLVAEPAPGPGVDGQGTTVVLDNEE